jgi:uncharacterized protein YbaR (Trm112 family)
MGVPKDLLKILACPDDKKSVAEIKTGKNKGNLKCSKCNRVFEVRGGIPIMMPKEDK